MKSEELVAMGQAAGNPLPEDFLMPHLTPYSSNFNLTDIDEIWENGTYQRNEFNLVWKVENGNFGCSRQSNLLFYMDIRWFFSEFGFLDDSKINSTGELLDLNTV